MPFPLVAAVGIGIARAVAPKVAPRAAKWVATRVAGSEGGRQAAQHGQELLGRRPRARPTAPSHIPYNKR